MRLCPSGKFAYVEEGYARKKLAYLACLPDASRKVRAPTRTYRCPYFAHPDVEIVPCKLVDEMWHAHILDTIAYRQDCDAIFGEFLDRFPYFGMRGDEDAQDLHDAYGDTLEAYERDFGTPPDGTWISADAASCKRTNCKPQKCK